MGMQQLNGAVRGAPHWFLRFEDLAVLIIAVLAYRHFGYSWWLFAILFLLPDISMLGYLRNPQLGALFYNGAHNFVAALVPALISTFIGHSILLAISLVWIAHIGFDRALGYGLKYPTSFNDTHLGRIGKPQVPAGNG
jgi:hypothetical protein